MRLLASMGLLLAATPLGMAAAVVAFFGAAYFTSSLVGLTVAGAAALVLVSGVATYTAARGLAGRSSVRLWLPVLVAGLGLTLGGLGAVALVFTPMDVEYVAMEPTDDVAYWNLPTGSRIAYWHTPAAEPARPYPVVFLHGGPGTPGTGSLGALADSLAAEGFHVFHYHQVGAGLSSRLEDVSEYTVARHVADLEAIRREIGVGRFILIGGSWGGTLAAHYMAAHGDRVERVVFASPGAIWRPAFAPSGSDPVPEGDGSELAIVAEAATPRFGVVYGLTRINPRAASNLASDEEMSGFMQPLLARIIRDDVAIRGADGEAVTAVPEGWVPAGYGFYAMMVTDASMNSTPDPRDMLRRVAAPALILRGEYDRLRPEVHLEYREVFPNAELVVVEGAGHSVSESPHFTGLLHAFLTGAQLPLQPLLSQRVALPLSLAVAEGAVVIEAAADPTRFQPCDVIVSVDRAPALAALRGEEQHASGSPLPPTPCPGAPRLG